MSKKVINYDAQINKVMMLLIKHVLRYVVENGLPGDHHFYIKFLTNHPRVVVQDQFGNPDADILKKYTYDMTIVLQNAFQSLSVCSDNFSVVLTFNGLPRKLTIPFDAIVAFHDPSVNFAIKFPKQMDDQENAVDLGEFDDYEDEEEDDEDSDEISALLEYDYQKYKSCSAKKIVYLNEIRKNL